MQLGSFNGSKIYSTHTSLILRTYVTVRRRAYLHVCECSCGNKMCSIRTRV